MLALFIFMAILIVLISYVIVLYNRLQRLRVNIDEAESQINVQLQRRSDLIPNLVNTVKGYAKHESSVLEKVTTLRANLTTGTTQDKINANNQLSSTLKSLFAVAESYPDLKANTNFASLQQELTNSEDKISYSRQLYNSCVAVFNKNIAVFPGNLIANLFKFDVKPYLAIDQAAKQTPQVKF